MPPIDVDWFDGDELTEIESSDEEEEIPPPPPPSPPIHVAPPRAKSTRPSTQTATEKSRARGGLQSVAPALKPYRSTVYSTSSLNEWISGGFLDLDAEYQRGIVWNEQKQMGLIDSIFRNYYIPPIVFTVTQTEDGNEKRVCIDGKQRLTSIRRFIRGEIPYKDVTTNKKLWFTSPPGARRKLISPAMQNLFKNKQIACAEYDAVTEEQEREIFQRVQMGMTLVPADRLPAINGPYADLVRGLRRRIESAEGFGAYQNWGEARGRDFQALSQIIYLMSHGTEPKKSEPTTIRLETFLGQAGVDVSVLEQHANLVLDIFIQIAQDPVLSKSLRGQLAMLEFVMAFYLIFTYRSAYGTEKLAAAIHHMRRKFSEVSPTRKVNTSIFKNMLNFVLTGVRKLKLEVPVEWSSPAGAKSEQIKVDLAKSSILHGTKSMAKRKFVQDDEDSDQEYIIPAKKAPKHKAESKPPVSSSSQASKASSKFESRLASKSSAKTTIRRTASSKQPTLSAGKLSVASSISSCGSGQVASPTIKAPYGRSSLPSSRKSSMTEGELAQSLSATSISPLATTPNSQPGPSGTNSRYPLPGRFPSVSSPLVPAVAPQFVQGQSNVINAGHVADSLISWGQDRLCSLPSGEAKQRASSLAVPMHPVTAASVDNGVAQSAQTPVSTASHSRTSKYPNFTKLPKDAPPATATNPRAPVFVGQPGLQEQQSLKPVPSLNQVLGVVQPPTAPTRDPRTRPAALPVRQDQPEQLPTPPQSSIPGSPQFLDKQPSVISSNAGGSNMQSLRFSAPPANSLPQTPVLPQQPPLKRIRPCPPYPGSGNQS